MWCPDGFFLVREIFNATHDTDFEELNALPPWLGGLGDVKTAIKSANERFKKFAKIIPNSYLDSRLIPYDDEEYISELDWPFIFSLAARYWLLGRFLFEERYNLYLVLPSTNCVRVSSEAAIFKLGSSDVITEDWLHFPREPEMLALLAMGGNPFNFRFPPNAYVLNVQDVTGKAESVGHLISQQLAPMNGAPLAWKARSGETPQSVLARLLKEEALHAEKEDEVASRPRDSASKLQVVIEEVWQAFPEGKGNITWETVVRRSGYSRRQIERAFSMHGGRDKWASGGQ